MVMAMMGLGMENFRLLSICYSMGWFGLREKVLIFIMAADPEPSHRIAFQNAQGATTPRHTNSPDVFLTVDTLEMKRGMEWVL